MFACLKEIIMGSRFSNAFNIDKYWVQELAYFLRIEAASGSPVRKRNKEKVIEICRVSNDINLVAIATVDQALKPVVTLEPHLSIKKWESNQDECLLIAEDGIRDAIWSNGMDGLQGS